MKVKRERARQALGGCSDAEAVLQGEKDWIGDMSNSSCGCNIEIAPPYQDLHLAGAVAVDPTFAIEQLLELSPDIRPKDGYQGIAD